MADVDIEPRNYPKILKLGEIESGINLLLNSYKTIQKDYIQSVKSGDTKKSAVYLKSLNIINNNLISYSNLIKDTMDEVYPLGIENQNIIQHKNPQLRRLATKLNKERDIFNNLQKKNDKLNGEKQSVELEYRSEYIKYIFMIILLIIVGALTIRSYMVPNSNSIETIILISALFLALYFIIKKNF
tara:strand:- start:2631 stop:3188 length:558 start_codon:yes stop_codon:yes gene_type:complete